MKEIRTKLPSFLFRLLQTDIEIVLVYNKCSSISELEKTFEEISVEGLNDSQTTELDLTGTPLEVNLGGDDLNISEMVNSVAKPNSWTNVEATYGPIESAAVRNVIRKYLMKTNPTPIYCICKPETSLTSSNNETVIIMGACRNQNQMIRTMVFAPRTVSNVNETYSIDAMKREHLDTVISNEIDNVETTYTIFKRWYKLGHDLKQCSDLKTSSLNASIAIESFHVTNTPDIPTTSFSVKCQVIIGHPLSKLNDLWLEIKLINSYMELLESADVETVISTKSMFETSQLKQQIHDLLKNTVSLNAATYDPDGTSPTFCHQLWNILKHCKTIRDLLECFREFATLVSKSDFKIVYSNNNNESIIDKIMCGLATNTCFLWDAKGCFGYLIEIGIEKVRNDYYNIITDLYLNSKHVIEKKWDAISSKIDLQLEFIKRMHFVAEFMHLFDKRHPDFHSFNYFLIIKYLANFPVTHSKLEANIECNIQLEEIHIPSICKNEVLPIDTYSVTLDTVTVNTTYKTVFYFTASPIIPETIYKLEPNLDNDDGEMSYLTKLKQISTKVC